MASIVNTENVEESIRQNIAIVDIRGETSDKLAKVYDEWGNIYDQQLTKQYYQGPGHVAEAIFRHMKDKKEAFILDFGCGTGIVAEQLAEYGFKNIEGLEPSKGMAQKAIEKGLYKKIYDCFLTDNVECLETDKYDAVVGCGCLEKGLVPETAIPEIFRCLKPGGYGFFIGEVDFFADSPVRTEMNKLEQAGKWKLLEEREYPYFIDVNGTLLVYAKPDTKQTN